MPNYKLLTAPLSEKQQLNQARPNDGWVKGIVPVALSEIVERDLDEFLDLLSVKLVGHELLSEIVYTIFGFHQNELHLEVQGSLKLTPQWKEWGNK